MCAISPCTPSAEEQLYQMFDFLKYSPTVLIGFLTALLFFPLWLVLPIESLLTLVIVSSFLLELATLYLLSCWVILTYNNRKLSQKAI